MNEPTASEAESRLHAILAAYLQAVQRGEQPAQAEWIARYPTWTTELQSFFANQGAVLPLAESLRSTPTLATSPAATAAPHDSNRFFGDYELLTEIARGGMGVVYKARQVSLNRIVALKMILSGQLASEADVQRFRAEAEAAGNLDHPNIVPIYEVGEHAGQHYFAMKYIEGGSLAGAECDQRRNAHLLATVARAVHHAHQRGILHRDLKPGNVLLDPAGQPHVTDFGLAKKVESDSGLTQSGAIVGTPSYMPPEQARAQKGLTTAVDVYSLGAILYELLTGRPPFQGPTPLDTLIQVLERDAVSPLTLKPTLDRDLSAVALKCLEKEPGKRYESAAALADDLDRWLRGEAITARPIGRLARGWRWCRRHPGVSASLAGVALSLVTTAVVSTVLALQTVAAIEVADENFKQADANLKLADQHATATDRERRENARLLARTYVERGNALANEGDWHQALPWYVEALRRTHDQPEEALSHRIRLGVLLRRSPRLVLTGFHNNSWHAGSMTKLLWSSDGRRLLTLGNDNTVRIWDLTTGQSALAPLRHPGKERITDAAFSPDNQRLATAGTGGMVRLTDLATGQELLTFDAQGAVETIGFSPDGNWLATNSIKAREGPATVRVWDVRTGKPVGPPLVYPYLNYCGIVWHPGGKQLATWGWVNNIDVWDIPEGKKRYTITGNDPEKSLSHPVFSPDGRLLVVDTKEGVTLYEATTGKVRATSDSKHGTQNLAFSADGRLLLRTTEQEEICLWDVEKNEAATTLKVPYTGPVTLSPDGRFVALNHEGTAHRKATQVYAVATGLPVTPLLRTEHEPRLQFCPTGRFLAVADWNIVRVWDLHGAEQDSILFPEASINDIKFLPDGQQWFWPDFDRGTHLVTRPSATACAQGTPAQATFFPYLSWLSELALRQDGQQIATQSENVVTLRATHSGKATLPPLKHPAKVLFHRYSPDGHRLATATLEGKPHLSRVYVWDTHTGERCFGPLDITTGLHFLDWTPDGTKLLGVTPLHWKVWDARDGRTLVSERRDDTSPQHVEVSQDSTRLLICDGQIAIYDLATGRLLGPPRRFQEELHRAHFLGGGAQVLVVPKGGRLRLLDAVTWEPLSQPPQGVTSFSDTTLALHQRVLAAHVESGRLQLWDTRTLLPLTPPLPLVKEYLYNLQTHPNQHELWLGGSETAEMQVLELSPLDWSLEELKALTDFLAEHAIDRTGSYEPMKLDEAAWKAVQARLPEFTRAPTREQTLVWQQRQFAECKLQAHWSAARFHLGCLIAAAPNPSRWYVERGLIFAAEGNEILSDQDFVTGKASVTAGDWQARARIWARARNWPRAERDLTQALALAPTEAASWSMRAQARLEQGKQAEAAQDLLAWEMHASPEAALEQRFVAGLLHLKTGNFAAYQRTCSVVWQHPERTTDPNPLTAACLLTLAPCDKSTLESLQEALGELYESTSFGNRFTEREFGPLLARRPPAFDGNRRVEMLAHLRGAVLYRRGLYQAALVELLKAKAQNAQPGHVRNFLFLALTYQQLGDGVSARAMLAAADQAMKEPTPDERKQGKAKFIPWEAALEWELLRQEAVRVIKP